MSSSLVNTNNSSTTARISTFHSHATATNASAPGNVANNNNNNSNGESSSSVHRMFLKLVQPCEADPKASVDKAWTLAIILKFFMVIAALVLILSKDDNGSYSHALVLAASWTVFLLCVMGAIGTFIIHRLSSNFSIGFFLGLLVIVSQQHVILFAAFNNYDTTNASNQIFATLSFLLGMVYLVFAIILWHFRDQVVIAAKELEAAPSLGSLKDFNVQQWNNKTNSNNNNITSTIAAASASSPGPATSNNTVGGFHLR